MSTELTSDLQTPVHTHAHAYMCTLDRVVSGAFRANIRQVPWEFPKAGPLASLRVLFGLLTPF